MSVETHKFIGFERECHRENSFFVHTLRQLFIHSYIVYVSLYPLYKLRHWCNQPFLGV